VLLYLVFSSSKAVKVLLMHKKSENNKTLQLVGMDNLFHPNRQAIAYLLLLLHLEASTGKHNNNNHNNPSLTRYARSHLL
jgi:hypothetical protein